MKQETWEQAENHVDEVRFHANRLVEYLAERANEITRPDVREHKLAYLAKRKRDLINSLAELYSELIYHRPSKETAPE